MVDSSGLNIKATMSGGQNSKIKMTTPENAIDDIYFPGKASWKCVGNLADGYIYLQNENVGGNIMSNPRHGNPYMGINGVDQQDIMTVKEVDITPESVGWVPKEMEC